MKKHQRNGWKGRIHSTNVSFTNYIAWASPWDILLVGLGYISMGFYTSFFRNSFFLKYKTKVRAVDTTSKVSTLGSTPSNVYAAIGLSLYFLYADFYHFVHTYIHTMNAKIFSFPSLRETKFLLSSAWMRCKHFIVHHTHTHE